MDEKREIYQDIKENKREGKQTRLAKQNELNSKTEERTTFVQNVPTEKTEPNRAARQNKKPNRSSSSSSSSSRKEEANPEESQLRVGVLSVPSIPSIPTQPKPVLSNPTSSILCCQIPPPKNTETVMFP